MNSLLKPHWDPSKTPAANLTSLGFLAHPNKAESSTAITSRINHNNSESDPAHAGRTTAATTTIIELFDVPESDAPSRRTKFPLDPEEEVYISKCLQKWGDNYTRMFRDLKVNTMQHTEEKLRKLGARFLLLSPDQRQMEVPEKVKHLVPDFDQRSE